MRYFTPRICLTSWNDHHGPEGNLMILFGCFSQTPSQTFFEMLRWGCVLPEAEFQLVREKGNMKKTELSLKHIGVCSVDRWRLRHLRPFCLQTCSLLGYRSPSSYFHYAFCTRLVVLFLLLVASRFLYIRFGFLVLLRCPLLASAIFWNVSDTFSGMWSLRKIKGLLLAYEEIAQLKPKRN